jgi:uncharacterized protein YndB with AHSA1/START domain
MTPDYPRTLDPSRDILAERIVNAPLARVWAAWTDPAQIPLWWGPQGFTCATKEIDIRSGGQWRFTMIGPDGTRYENRVRFPTITPQSVIDYFIDDDGAGMVAFPASARFTPMGDKTKVEMHSRFASYEALVTMEKYRAREGLHSTLACLDAYVQST